MNDNHSEMIASINSTRIDSAASCLIKYKLNTVLAHINDCY